MHPCFSFQLQSTTKALWQNKFLFLCRDLEVDIFTIFHNTSTKLLNASAKKVFYVQQKYMVGKGRESSKDSSRISVTSEEINTTGNSSVIIALFYLI